MSRLTDTVPAGVIEPAHRSRLPLACIPEAGLRLTLATNAYQTKVTVSKITHVAGFPGPRLVHADPTDAFKSGVAIKTVHTSTAGAAPRLARPLPADEPPGAVRVVAVIAGPALF